MGRYRDRQEMIEYFYILSDGFRKDATEEGKRGNGVLAAWDMGKAEAYEMAAFELEHNMEG